MQKTADKIDYFRSLLRSAGYRATPRRVSVLSIFENAKQPLSPQSVINRLKTRADQATIYRNLKAFQKSGILRQVDFRHNHPHYELADVKDHHHLICMSCGLSEEILGCEIDAMKQSALREAKHFGEIYEHSLEFYGRCKTCLKQAPEYPINR